MVALLPGGAPAALGLGLSGGGDSMALLGLLAAWAAPRGVALHAATVDHGLRPEAAAEAQMAGAAAERCGAHHDVLRWTCWDGSGNLQDRARQARLDLLANWARERGLGAVCLGHTQDDQAETVLLRLARGSGVDGLAGIPTIRADPSGILWLRPLLGMSRQELRAYLRGAGEGWAEDPSNADPGFDRVRARRILADLADLGLTAGRLSETAARMQAAREVLGRAASEAAARLVSVEAGDILIAAEGYAALPDETRWRLLSEALRRVAGAIYRPRFSALTAADAALRAGSRSTLHGCLVTPGKRHRVAREPASLAGVRAPAPGIWDRRWEVAGPAGEGGFVTAALGPAGLEAAGGRGVSGLPHATLVASPAVWRGATLVAAPLLGYGDGWSARLIWDKAAFCAGLLSH